MADEPVPQGTRQQVAWHRADGTPTDNPDEADSAEVTTTRADGTVTHRLMRRASAGVPSDE